MLRFLGYLSVYLIYSLSSFAQDTCTIYHTEEKTFNFTNSENVHFIKTNSSPTESPEIFAALLTDASIFVSFDKGTIITSTINGAGIDFIDPNVTTVVNYSNIHSLQGYLNPHHNWEPILLKYSSIKAFFNSLSCQGIKQVVQDSKISRQSTQNLFKYIFNKPSPKTLGETIINLEWAFLKYKKSTLIDREKALSRYNSILNRINSIPNLDDPEKFFITWKAILEIIYSNNKEDINYCTERTMLTSALLNGCINCVGETSLFTALLQDSDITLPDGWSLQHQFFSNHIRPILYNETGNETFDLTYGVFDEVSAAIIPWREALKATLRGYDLTLHSLEQRKIDEQIPYTHNSFFCLRQGFDLGYETRHQIQNFSGLRVCESFSDAPQPGDEEEVDTENRLKQQKAAEAQAAAEKAEATQSALTEALEQLEELFSSQAENNEEQTDTLFSELEEGPLENLLNALPEGTAEEILESAAQEEATDLNKAAEQALNQIQEQLGEESIQDLLAPSEEPSGFDNNNEQLRHSADNSERITSGFYRSENDDDTAEDTDEMPTDLTIQLNGNGMTPHKFFKKFYYPVRENLSTQDRQLVSNYVQNGAGADETLRHFRIKNLFDKLGIQKGILREFDSKIDNLQQETILDQPVKPLVIELNEKLPSKVIYNSFNASVEVSDPEIFIHLLTSNTIDRYVTTLELLKEIVSSELEGSIERFFNTDDLAQSLKNQTRTGHYFPSTLMYIRYYHSLFKLGVGASYENGWSLEYTFLTQEIPKLMRIIEYQKFIAENPLLFIEAIDHAQESYGYANPIIFEGMFSGSFSHLKFDTAPLKYFLREEDGFYPEFPKGFYKGFTHNFLFNKDYFFTAEPNEEELEEISQFRPYSPKLIQEAVKETYEAQKSVTLPINPYIEPCKPGDTGMVQRGLFYIECSVEKSETSEAGEIQEGLENGLDSKGEEVELSNLSQTIPPSENVDTTDGTEQKEWTEEDYKTHLIDPREEIILEKNDWEDLFKVMSPHLSSIKNTFAVHHLQRESIKDLILKVNNLDQVIYSNLVGLPKISVNNLEGLLSDSSLAFTELVDILTGSAQYFARQEEKEGIPYFFLENLFEKVVYLEAVNSPKDNWTLDQLDGKYTFYESNPPQLAGGTVLEDEEYIVIPWQYDIHDYNLHIDEYLSYSRPQLQVR